MMSFFLLVLFTCHAATQSAPRCCCIWNAARACLPGFRVAACAEHGFACATETPTAAPTPVQQPLSCQERLALTGWHDEAGDYLPVPQRSLPDFSDGFRSDLFAFDRHIGSRTHWISETVYQSVVEEGDNSLTVIDCPPNMIQPLLAVIAELQKPVTRIVYSHAHHDHIGACGQITAQFPDAQVVASDWTAQFLDSFTADAEQRPRVTTALSDAQLEGGHRIEEDGVVVELFKGSGAHTPGDMAIYLPSSKLVVYIDVVFPRWVPFRAWAVSESLPEYADFAKWILEFPRSWEHFASGHLGRIATREDVVEWAEYMQDVISFMVEEALKKFATAADFFTQWVGSTNNWWSAIAHFDRPGFFACARKLIEKYGTRLGGVDVFAYGHCVKARDFLQVDTNDYQFQVPLGSSGRRRNITDADLRDPAQAALLHQVFRELAASKGLPSKS